jgi:NifU-like protein involved in Fe-S cluster formation
MNFMHYFFYFVMAMADGFDKFVDELQDEINKDVQRDYSPNSLDLIARQPNFGPMEDATASGTSTEASGDAMTFFLLINMSQIIEKATYTTNACKPALACGSQATFLVRGKNIQTARAIDAREIARALGKFPAEHQHYIDLAYRALKEALISYQDKIIDHE